MKDDAVWRDIWKGELKKKIRKKIMHYFRSYTPMIFTFLRLDLYDDVEKPDYKRHQKHD